MRRNTVVLAILGLGVGLAGGHVLTPSHESDLAQIAAQAEEAIADAAQLEDSRQQSLVQLTELRGSNRRLDQQNTALEQRLSELRDQVESLEAANAASQATADAEAPRVGSEAPIPFPTWEKVLARVDWKKDVGESMSAIVPMVAQIAGAIERGETPPAEAMGVVQQHNGPLVVVAMKLLEEGVPGTRGNGALTHPVIMVNSVASTLEVAGLPLNAEQVRDLARIGSDFAARDERRLTGYDDRRFRLEVTADETDLKRDFFDAVFATLSQEQGETLSPQLTRRRQKADMFSEVLIWTKRTRPMVSSDRADLTAQAQEFVPQLLSLPVDSRAAANRIIADWVDSIPETYLTTEMDALDKVGMFRSEQISAGAEHTLRLLKNLVNGLDLSEAEETRIRRFRKTMVLYRASDS